ncbi:hypothetical protein [uncultured Paraglaciecola sp.]|uniref:hypothetical protein n=1 Tax=uncultured Paraglaciecola sp. TaxID=1765024 RepID=UPI0030D7A1F9|tara:strand:+ start:7725 stop:9209 length:1485 start_codon:yes stop_codon:yes gene_type:complete
MTTSSDNAFTKSVTALVARINDVTQTKESLFEQAEIYFQGAQSQQRIILQLTKVVEEKCKDIETAKNDIQRNHLRELHNDAKKDLRVETAKQDRLRYVRLKYLNEVCTDIIQLCEGRNWQETQQKSAKVLTTLLLICPTQGKNVAQCHQRCKPLYKAVLSLRLLDQMLASKYVENEYIVSRYHLSSRFSTPPASFGPLNLFQKDVAVPLISAALLQDIGMQHPEIQRLLKGADGALDPYRVLDKEVRVPLLIMNHEQTIEYVSEGLGTGHFDEENDDSDDYMLRKDRFDKSENNRARLLRSMLDGAIKPKEALGSTIKAAQIYTSIVLSTKPNFNFEDLPKATKVVIHSAQRGALTLNSAESLQKIMGHFPPGFGVVFCLANDADVTPNEFSYALVNSLNPTHVNEPTCHVVSALGERYPLGNQCTISAQQNLYFEQVHNRFSTLTPAILDAIAQKIATELDQPKNREAIPRTWSPHSYFHFKKQQNLWINSKG